MHAMPSVDFTGCYRKGKEEECVMDIVIFVNVLKSVLLVFFRKTMFNLLHATRFGMCYAHCHFVIVLKSAMLVFLGKIHVNVYYMLHVFEIYMCSHVDYTFTFSV